MRYPASLGKTEESVWSGEASLVLLAEGSGSLKWSCGVSWYYEEEPQLDKFRVCCA